MAPLGRCEDGQRSLVTALRIWDHTGDNRTLFMTMGNPQNPYCALTSLFRIDPHLRLVCFEASPSSNCKPYRLRLFVINVDPTKRNRRTPQRTGACSNQFNVTKPIEPSSQRQSELRIRMCNNPVGRCRRCSKLWHFPLQILVLLVPWIPSNFHRRKIVHQLSRGQIT